MRIKYSPVMFNAHSPACVNINPNTEIRYVSENAINIDGEDYEFDPLDVQWPTISQDTEGVILEAHRDTELHLVVRRFYQSNCSEWDSGTEVHFGP